MTSRHRLVTLLNSANSSRDVVSKLQTLRQFDIILSEQGQVIQNDDVDSLFSELLPRLFQLQSDDHSPVRKAVARIIGDIGLRHLEFVPEIVPVLMGVLEDRAPAVARQAIACGIDLFRVTLQKIAIQGLHTSELDDMLKSSWSAMLEFKEKVISIAFQPGSGGVRLLALKFVESVILLYTPDPCSSPEPPTLEGKPEEFNISRIRGRHPVLNVGDLSIEASKRLSLLLDQLRFPFVKSLSNLVIIVLVNSLATIAKERPPYYGRILPVLLGLYPSNSNIEGMRLSGTCHALKNAFVLCLKCTHPGAAPWRSRLVGALRGMKEGELAEEVPHVILKNNRSIEESKEDSLVVKEEKPCANLNDDTNNNVGRKRLIVENSGDLEENSVSRKRIVRQTPSSSEESTKDPIRNMTDSQGDISSNGRAANKVDDDNGPVQQLVAMFGALIAQGEKAIGSLEILIASISADLLAEVVMANMHYLPTNEPQAEGHDEMLENMTMVGSDSHAKYPSSFLAHVYSLSSSFPPIASKLNAHESAYSEMVASHGDEQLHADGEVDVSVDHETTSREAENDMSPATLLSSNVKFPGLEMDGIAVPSDVNDVGGLENDITGLDSSARNDRLSETMDASSLVSTDLENASQEQAASLGAGLSQDMLPVSTDRSEELNSFTNVMDSGSIISSTAMPAGLPSTIVLPKMSAPVVNLGDKEKDQLQSLAFIRIVEAYKQMAVSGGSDVHFSLIANLGVEFPSELEPWPMLQKHILSDYVGHEGHELTLRVLYRLFCEMEAERDFFSSTAASSVYEMFILTVAETLKDSFPASDKSLSKLLGEAPYLPKSVLKLLEMLCSPGASEKPEKDIQSGDRVTQGLSTVWNLIMLRPPIREVCLKIALQSAVHHLEEVRMKAIRLVANKLYPLSFIAQQIEDFATETLMSSANDDSIESMNTDGPVTELQKDSNLEKASIEHQPVSDGGKDLIADAHQPSPDENISPDAISEAQRCLSLYFALCTKKHSLFRQIFVVYGSASKSVKKAVDRHIPILIRTIGSSPGLLEIILDPPHGSENLLMQVLQTLTDGVVPSPELISTVRKLFESRLKDAEILIPILPFLSRDEILPVFPHLVNLPPDKFQVALNCILQGSSRSAPVLTPEEVLIAIHGIDPDRDGIPLKKVTDACNACFDQRQIFTQQVLAKVLNQLVEQTPLPLLFMRTVLQTIGAFPGLVGFIMEILSRLVSKQIWKYPKLWVGFLKCAQLTKPQSFSVLLQLPPPQLENALNRIAALRAPLVAHASQPNIKSSLPRSVLAVLGIASDTQTASQAQASQTRTDTQSSQAQANQSQRDTQCVSQAQASQTQTDTQSASQAQGSQTQTDIQSASQAQGSQAQTDTQSVSQAQANQNQPVDTANSDKEVQSEISKDSSVAC